MVFRGTYSLTNTIVDLSARLQPYVPYTGGGNGTKCSNCTVHAGFMASWENARSTVFPHVLAAQKEHPDYDLVLVGHSLGGAVAALAGLEMQSRGWKPQVTTFGEPRVGNGPFAEFLDELFGLYGRPTDRGKQLKFRRVTHVDDPVPLLPMEELGYKMHGGEIYISKSPIPPSITDIHLCDGDQDARCIAAGAGPSASKRFLGLWPLCNNNERKCLLSIMKIMNQECCDNADADDDSDNDGSGSVRSIIPSRYRIWELLFAHRDYFWRLGFCVPGGDPSRFRSQE